MRRRGWIVSSLIVLAIVLGNNVLRAETTTEEIIARLETKAATVDSFQADLAMTIEMMGQKTVSRGRMIFEKPNKSWMEMDMNMGFMTMRQITISDGKTTWAYQPEMNIVTKIDLEKIAAEIGEEAREQVMGNISKPFQGFQRESISCIGTEKKEERKEGLCLPGGTRELRNAADSLRSRQDRGVDRS